MTSIELKNELTKCNVSAYLAEYFSDNASDISSCAESLKFTIDGKPTIIQRKTGLIMADNGRLDYSPLPQPIHTINSWITGFSK
jgi:hypothetical protein